MKEYVLNVQSSMLHEKDCFCAKKYKESKWRSFHTIEEATRSCENIKFCKRCNPNKEK